MPALTNHPHGKNWLKGEISGAYLLGIVTSFRDVSVIQEADLPFDVRSLDPSNWYPYSYLIQTIELIESDDSISENILFQAGINFLRIWYEHGPGKDTIFSTLDWLHANDEGGGYNSVARAGSKEDIGWCKTLSMDNEKGCVVIENVMPLRGEYLRGLFYGGCKIFDDTSFIKVESSEQPYPGNENFFRTLITVHFRLRDSKSLHKKIDDLPWGERLLLGDEEVQDLVWEYKSLKNDLDLAVEYEKDNATLLSSAYSGARKLASALETKKNELEVANREIAEARDRAEATLEELKKTQERLVTTEKIASLGQLTAGIAHEIKNPLNFVNNFSETSVELLAELKEVLEPVHEQLGEDTRDEIDDIVGALKGDLQKINHHGRRADSIVKSMLLHARGDTGERVPTPVNDLVQEALSLAYHGERARDMSFQVTMEEHFDEAAGLAELVPQEITRVLVNLFGNAFYALVERGRDAGAGDYSPTIAVWTEDKGRDVEIRVRDNGTGMPKDVREKLFDPFFTTKPTGEGTGLGLSMSFDIIVQQHGGRIDVDSEPGAFTEFTITLPRHLSDDQLRPDLGKGT